MKPISRSMVALMVVVAACFTLSGAFGADPQQAAAAAARLKDPAWAPTCVEIAAIKVGKEKRGGALKNFCLNDDGNILACYAPSVAPSLSDTKNAVGIRVYTPEGELLKTLPLEIRPSAVCVGKDGVIFVAGEGKLLKLDAAGKVLAAVASPVADAEVKMTKELEELLEGSGIKSKEQKEQMLESLEKRRGEVLGIATTADDVFMAVPSPTDFSFRVYRFDTSLQNPKLVVDKLRGCCGQMDVQAHDGKLWIPHNARHTVETRDRDGATVAKFGTKGKVKAADFGGCCEPKNLRVLPSGEILTAESGPPTSIKRFSATGEFLGVVALLETKGECVRVTVATNKDQSRFYLLDTQLDIIRVFAPKK